ncbi:MAG: hypothetical protein EOO41_04695 [Methanobacteriota archaeon]|nr:MAG: hypothetical protein EOO41_04695 [Euryarchaeota archaeon]
MHAHLAVSTASRDGRAQAPLQATTQSEGTLAQAGRPQLLLDQANASAPAAASRLPQPSRFTSTFSNTPWHVGTGSAASADAMSIDSQGDVLDTSAWSVTPSVLEASHASRAAAERSMARAGTLVSEPGALGSGAHRRPVFLVRPLPEAKQSVSLALTSDSLGETAARRTQHGHPLLVPVVSSIASPALAETSSWLQEGTRAHPVTQVVPREQQPQPYETRRAEARADVRPQQPVDTRSKATPAPDALAASAGAAVRRSSGSSASGRPPRWSEAPPADASAAVNMSSGSSGSVGGASTWGGGRTSPSAPHTFGPSSMGEEGLGNLHSVVDDMLRKLAFSLQQPSPAAASAS